MAKKKTSRRGNGEGSIYERKKGQWAAVVTIGRKPDGKPNRKFFYGKTRAEVAEKLREAQNQLAAGAVMDPGKMTVADWLNLWLESYVRPNVREATYDNYRDHLDNHLIPGIGHIKLKKLTTTDIQVFFKELLTNGNKRRVRNEDTDTLELPGYGLAPSTLICIRNIIKAALEQAVMEKKIPYNPAKATKAPKAEKREMTILSQEELTQFLDATTDYRYYAAYVIAVSTGVRRGEVLGLPWTNVSLGMDWDTLDKVLPWGRIAKLRLWDTDALAALLEDEGVQLDEQPTIYISQQLSDLQAGPSLEEPKTALSRRRIDIPMDTALTIVFQRYLQREEAKTVGKDYNPEALVFCTNTGAYVPPRTFTRIFQGALAHAGVKKVRFHDLRHTVATMLLEDGAQLNSVQELLGHYNPAFTATQYGHVTKRMRKETTERLGNMLQAAKKKY